MADIPDLTPEELYSDFHGTMPFVSTNDLRAARNSGAMEDVGVTGKFKLTAGYFGNILIAVLWYGDRAGEFVPSFKMDTTGYNTYVNRHFNTKCQQAVKEEMRLHKRAGDQRDVLDI